MRDRSKRHSAQAPKIPTRRKPEIDRNMEEAFTPPKEVITTRNPPREKWEATMPEAIYEGVERGNFLSLKEKDRVLEELTDSITACIDSLTILLGTTSELSVAKTEINSLLNRWRSYHEV